MAVRAYKENKINTIRFNEFDSLLGVHFQYKTLSQDIDKFTYPRGYQFQRYDDVEYVDRFYLNFKDIKMKRGKSVVEDNTARAFGTPEETANQIRDDLQYNGINYTESLGVVIVTDRNTLANKELIDSYTRILGLEKLGFTGWVFDVIFISENVTKSVRVELKKELAQRLNRHSPRTEQSMDDVIKTGYDAIEGKNLSSAEIQKKVMRMTSSSKVGEVTNTLVESTSRGDSYTLWKNEEKRRDFCANLKELHGIEPFVEAGEYDESRKMGGSHLYEQNLKRWLFGMIESWYKNHKKPEYKGEYLISSYMTPTKKLNLDDRETNLHKGIETLLYKTMMFCENIKKTGKIPLFHEGKYPMRNEHDILTKTVKVKERTFSFPSYLKLTK
mgnify:CR=1 FL=1